MLELLRDTYHYRELIWILALKELKVRYKRSLLGVLWAFLNPLMMTAIFVVVFSKFRVGRFGIEHYAIFLLCAMFPFTFYQQSMAYAVQSIIANGSLIKKVYIPKLVFPLAAVLANFFNLMLSLIPLAFFLWVFDHPFHKTWLYLPVPMLGLLLFTAGCGFAVAALGVFLHDIGHILEVFLRAFFFLCPVLYDLDHIPARFHPVLIWNPMLHILRGFRLPIYAGELPEPASALISILVGVVAVVLGYAIFRRFQDSFAIHV
ncbi:ABC transporter permease [Acidobacteriia bacterium AH_259_A11_L15]|nr:ABC transporter permease [Acidobacteriia bacterium AH_259_A11_L15]